MRSTLYPSERKLAMLHRYKKGLSRSVFSHRLCSPVGQGPESSLVEFQSTFLLLYRRIEICSRVISSSDQRAKLSKIALKPLATP